MGMASSNTLRRWWMAHPAASEIVAGCAVGGLVAVVVAWQYDLTPDAWIRGASLGPWLGLALGWSIRRRRTAAAREAVARQAGRLELARELHDTVAGQVSVIGIQAAAARRILETRPTEAAAALERIEAVSRSANADLRRMLDALRGDTPTTAAAEPGIGQLADLVAGIEAAGQPVRLAIHAGSRPAGDVAVDRAAYRIVQEALTNAVRHARGAPVTVDVRRDGDTLLLAVVNGPGPGADHEGGGGLGLVGIRERAALFGGSAEAGPTPEGGFAVRARLPLRPGT